MAKPRNSELLDSADLALQSCDAFHNTIVSFDSNHPCVRDLLQVLEELSEVLDSLSETIHGISGTELSLLRLPLQRCGHACKELEQELLKCSSRSSGDRTKFRHWTKLRYKGNDIERFRRLLTGYKLTVQVALLHATLPENSLTAEDLESYRNLVQTATDHLSACLESAVSDHEILLEQNVTSADPKIELEHIEEEKLAVERCLQVCEQFSEHLSQIQPTSERSVSPDNHPRETISVIENYGTGDVMQFMVSANGKVLYGKNRSLGWRGGQVGGYLSNFTVRNLSRDMLQARLRNTGGGSMVRDDILSSRGGSTESGHPSDFEKRWGRGRTQKPESNTGEVVHNMRLAE